MGMKPIDPNVINYPIGIEEFKNIELIQPFFLGGGGGRGGVSMNFICPMLTIGY